MVLAGDRRRVAEARADDEGGPRGNLAESRGFRYVLRRRTSKVGLRVLIETTPAGAVYALVTLTALSFPSTSVSLIFLPFFPIPIGVATSALVAVDIVGLLRGWRMFDHAAHLAGAAMGAAWFAGGHALFERLRAAMWDGQKERLVEQRRLSRS